MSECILCRPDVDAELGRIRLWEDDVWRLCAVSKGPVPGRATLEPKRHVPFVTDLDGSEAATLGPVLARSARALLEAAKAERTYVYVFGDRVHHLHFVLAPHRAGDALQGGVGILHAGATDADPAAHERITTAAREALQGFAVG